MTSFNGDPTCEHLMQATPESAALGAAIEFRCSKCGLRVEGRWDFGRLASIEVEMTFVEIPAP